MPDTQLNAITPRLDWQPLDVSPPKERDLLFWNRRIRKAFTGRSTRVLEKEGFLLVNGAFIREGEIGEYTHWATIPPPEESEVMTFARALSWLIDKRLAGVEETHKAWLMEAAKSWTMGQAIPEINPPNPEQK